METTGTERWRAEGKKNMELSKGEEGLGGQQWGIRLGYVKGHIKINTMENTHIQNI